MNNAILASFVAVVIVATALGATYAYFSDTETSAGNTVTAGVLNLKFTDCYDGCTSSLTRVVDMKPSYTRYSEDINLTFSENPGKLYKRITNIMCFNGDRTEPEAEEECNATGCCEKKDLTNYTWLDIARLDGQVWTTIIPDQNISMKDITANYVYLGAYYPGDLKFRESYHLFTNVTNWAQSDWCGFDEEFVLLQDNAPSPANCINPAGYQGMDNTITTNYTCPGDVRTTAIVAP
jgi:predicted ribosomally synthesized peptide with SipW-like signal peptide